EVNDARQVFDVLVLIYAQIPISDPAPRLDRACLEDDERCATHGTAAMVYEMPIVREAVVAGVLAHRRDHDAVLERDIAHPQRLEEMGRRRKCGWAGVVHVVYRIEKRSSGCWCDNVNARPIRRGVNTGRY